MQEYQFERFIEVLDRIATALEREAIDPNQPLLVTDHPDPLLKFVLDHVTVEKEVTDEGNDSEETS